MIGEFEMKCCRISDFVRIITEDSSTLMENRGSISEYMDLCNASFLLKECMVAKTGSIPMVTERERKNLHKYNWYIPGLKNLSMI